MKKIVFASIILIGLIGCNALSELTQFDMDYTETITIPATTLINLPFNLDDQEISSNSSSTFASNNTNKDLIEKITLQSMKLDHKSPSDYDLRFLESISIFLSAEGLSEIEIAWKNNIDNNVGKVLQLETSDADLKEYVKKDDMVLRVETTFDESFPDDQVIDINTSFFVDAKVLGF